MADKISGLAAGAVGAGALLVYAGITGKDLAAAVRALITGQSPATAPITNPITGTTASGGTGGPPLPRGTTGTAWSTALLSALGAPVTPANVASINGWQGREGGGGANNPLNTTQPEPGSTSFNSVGVQNYPTVAEGIAATVTTLNNGRYGDILLLLGSGQGLCGHSLAGLSTWSGGGYSSVC